MWKAGGSTWVFGDENSAPLGQRRNICANVTKGRIGIDEGTTAHSRFFNSDCFAVRFVIQLRQNRSHSCQILLKNKEDQARH
jgi:hypothetical protein